MKKGQLSAEMLILLVLILALVAVVYTQLTNTVNETSKGVDIKTQDALNVGNYCDSVSQCNPKDTEGSQLDCVNNKCAYKQ